MSRLEGVAYATVVPYGRLGVVACVGRLGRLLLLVAVEWPGAVGGSCRPIGPCMT